MTNSSSTRTEHDSLTASGAPMSSEARAIYSSYRASKVSDPEQRSRAWDAHFAEFMPPNACRLRV